MKLPSIFWIYIFLLSSAVACESTQSSGYIEIVGCNSNTFITEYGVNMAGADFGNVPGVYGTDYSYPDASKLPYYINKGLRLFRLPFKWARIQRTLLGPLDATELGRIQTFLSGAAALGANVVIDLHDFGNYLGTPIGQGSVTQAAYVDLWTKLATALHGTPGLAGYDIMNEPQGFADANVWPNAAQAVVTAIRAVDSKTKIYMEGDCWSAAWSWTFCNNTLNVSDPANNMIYEAHQYFDANSSGNYANSYDTDNVTPTTGSDRIAAFIAWLRANNHRGMIGEYSVPDDGDARWLTTLGNMLTNMDQNCFGGTYWAGGPRWGDTPTAIEPIGGVDRPQMAVVQQHIGVSCVITPSNPALLEDKSRVAPGR